MYRAWSSLRPRPYFLQQLRRLADNNEKIKYGEDFVHAKSRPRIFLARKFLEFVERYEGLMQRHTPTAFEVYNSLGKGTKLLYKDIQTYLAVSRDLNNGRPVNELSRKELELFYKVPNDMIHVAPTLLICALPLTNYIIFPLLYVFPKQLLSSQFWTARQWRYFEVEKHLARVQYHDNVLFHLERTHTTDSSLQEKHHGVISKLRSGGHPTVEEILEVKPLFQDGHALALHNLSYGHLRALGLSQGFSFGGVMPYGKLWRFGGFIWEMDRALVREGPLESLTDDDIAKCCLARGFNPLGCSRAEAEEFLHRWLTLSMQLTGRELSLLLHSPIFFAYNHHNSFGSLLMKSSGEGQSTPLKGVDPKQNQSANVAASGQASRTGKDMPQEREQPKTTCDDDNLHSKKTRAVL